jgi:hypothetical protein
MRQVANAKPPIYFNDFAANCSPTFFSSNSLKEGFCAMCIVSQALDVEPGYQTWDTLSTWAAE